MSDAVQITLIICLTVVVVIGIMATYDGNK